MCNAEQVEERDVEIANLRQKLGSAREEVLARKADARNVVAQMQLMAPAEVGRRPELGKLATIERKIFGKNKFKGGFLPTSKSLLSLNHSETEIGLGNEDAGPGTRSAMVNMAFESRRPMYMEVRSAKASDDGWSCGMGRKKSVPELRRAQESTEDLTPRPRKDSLDEMGGIGLAGSASEHPVLSSVNTEKELPLPPGAHSQYESVRDGGRISTVETLGNGMVQNLRPPEVPNHDFCSQPSPSKRILSGIPELSSEDTESDGASVSATSSDREAYRKNVDALNLIEILRESDMRAHDGYPDYEGSGYGPPDANVEEARASPSTRSSERFEQEESDGQAEESPAISVREMYHAAGRKQVRTRVGLASQELHFACG